MFQTSSSANMATRTLTLRLKTKDGQHVVNNLTLESTIDELKSKITELTKIPSTAVKILKGFPPIVVEMMNSNDTLASIKLRSGDTLIVEEDQSLLKQAREEQNVQLMRDIQSQWQSSNGVLTRQIVPANNSFLFTSVNFVMENGKLDLTCADEMRQLIASIVLSDSDTYNEAFLEKSNADYCAWIMNDQSWGGAIEVSILSKYFSVEIDIVDTQFVRINKFGEDQNYPQRVLLIYDGIHYDPLMLESFDEGVPPVTKFSTRDDSILGQALTLAGEAKASRQFTDVSGFSLRCLVCNKALVGQTEAQSHAKQTGHINFGEY